VLSVVQEKSILVLGALYGLLFAGKLIAAGFKVHIVCLKEEAERIASDGFDVRFPLSDETLFTLTSSGYPGLVSASAPENVDLSLYSLAVFAMQEPQYSEPKMAALVRRLARSKISCVSIMNMPPLAYLKRLPSLSGLELGTCYRDATLWEAFDPNLFTHASADPQIFRPEALGPTAIQVRLSSNFKIAPLPEEEANVFLREIKTRVRAVRIKVDGKPRRAPVLINLSDDAEAGLIKWPMLMTGNYRCLTPTGLRSIKSAVQSDIDESREIYEAISALCLRLGVKSTALVPFEAYLKATNLLGEPSSVAKAVHSGAPHVERVDKLIQLIGNTLNIRHDFIDTIAGFIDLKLNNNRHVQ
jgi:hypothetical protein